MFGTTKEFLEYFGLKKLEDLPTLAELKDGLPELSPQTDLLESLEAAQGVDAVLSEGEGGASLTVLSVAVEATDEDDAGDESDLGGPDLLGAEDSDDESTRAKGFAGDEPEDAEVQSADVIPLRATEDEQ